MRHTSVLFIGSKLWKGRLMHQTTFSLGDQTPCYSTTHTEVRTREVTPDIPELSVGFNLLSLDIHCCRVSAAGETTAGRWCST